MLSNNNILLITEDTDISSLIMSKLVLLRANDAVETCTYSEYKKILETRSYKVVILHECTESETTIKIISKIKETVSDVEILLLLENENKELILKAYDNGIFDYIFTNSPDYEILIKTVNCFKMQLKKDRENRNDKFLHQLGVTNSKTNLYEYKYLKELFVDLTDNLRIKNGIFTVLTLDEKIKTKVSTNRLAGIIKNSLRGDDIGAIGRGGKFYVILPNIDTAGTKYVIEKFQTSMGEDFPIRAGLAKIGIHSFETLDKIANDGMISAIQNEVSAVCLEESFNTTNLWLEDDNCEIQQQKSFKLFKNIFENKLNNTIIPVFYRYQKDFETKLTNTNVSQYANNIECVFSLKNGKIHSELIIRYDNYAKFNIKITHSGLDSAENTELVLPLNKLNAKQLTALLLQLKEEYKQTAFKKGD